MSVNNDIINSIREICKVPDTVYSLICTVMEIDLTNNTVDCEPLDGSPDVLGVQLVTQNNGFLIIPKLESKVTITFIDEDNAFVSMFSEVDDIQINLVNDFVVNADNILFTVDTEIQLNGDNYDGLVKIGDLITKLNNLENKVNTIINTFNTHTHPYVDSGSPATTSPSTSPVSGTLTPTQQADLENTTVKHGG